MAQCALDPRHKAKGDIGRKAKGDIGHKAKGDICYAGRHANEVSAIL
jgi:hypothetical protein